MAVFAAVVEEGSFRAASDRLGLSSSVVSHHVSTLEKRLNRVLLHRSSRKLTLTDEGTSLYQAARDMVASAQFGIEALVAGESGARGKLRVNVPSFLSSGMIVNIVTDFLLAHPKVSMDLDFTRAQRHPINDPYDLVIGTYRRDSNSISVLQLEGAGAGFYAAPDLADRIGRIPAQDIATKIPLLLSSGFTTNDWVEVLAANGVTVDGDLEYRLKCDDLAMIHQLCRSGAGLAVLPHSCAALDLASGRLVAVMQDYKLAQAHFFALWATRSPKSHLIQRFLSHIEVELERFSRTGGKDVE